MKYKQIVEVINSPHYEELFFLFSRIGDPVWKAQHPQCNITGRLAWFAIQLDKGYGLEDPVTRRRFGEKFLDLLSITRDADPDIRVSNELFEYVLDLLAIEENCRMAQLFFSLLLAESMKNIQQMHDRMRDTLHPVEYDTEELDNQKRIHHVSFIAKGELYD